MRRIFFGVGFFLLAAVGRLPARRKIGALLGLALMYGSRRRHIVDVNLRLTQPHLSDRQRQRIRRRHFQAIGEWLMDTLWSLSASRKELGDYIKIEGELPASGIILMPHFVGMEIVGLYINLQQPRTGYYYKPLHNQFWNALVQRLRMRFGGVGFSTSSKYSLLAAVRFCRRGGVLCYLPDIDTRTRKSTVYVPFMAVEQAATTTATSRLARAARAPVVPCIICRTKDGYTANMLPPLDDFPGDDAAADTARINALIGEWVEKNPENYFWLHRRFKTDANGKTRVYD